MIHCEQKRTAPPVVSVTRTATTATGVEQKNLNNMARERMFNFVPLGKERGKIPGYKFGVPYASVTKSGLMMINRKSFERLGIGWETKMIKLYCDHSKLSIAWKFIEKTANINEGVRLVKPIINKNGYEYLQIGIRAFTRDFPDLQLPAKGLEIKEYEDTDPYLGVGKVYYITLPTKK